MLVAIVMPAWLGAQPYILQGVDLINMGGYYRVEISCTGPAKYVERFDEEANRLSLFFGDTRSGSASPNIDFSQDMLRHVEVSQWQKNPPVTRVDIELAPGLHAEVKKSIDGLYFVDVTERFQRSLETAAGHQPDSDWENRYTARPAKTGSYYRPVPGKSATRKAGPAVLRNAGNITVDVHAADISNVLRLLAAQSGLNIVAGREVTGPVTVSLTDVTLKEALDVVVKSNGLDYTVAGDVVVVKSREQFDSLELQTKVYRLQYLDANNLKGTVAQVLSPQAKVQVFYSNFQGGATGSGSGGGEEGGESGARRRSSTLIVTDSGEKIEHLTSLIEALDVPTPQVMIEAKLIEVSPQNETKLGIDWDKSITGSIFRDVVLPSGEAFQFAAEIPLEGGSVNYGTLSIEKYGAVLNFLSSRTNSKLISNPRIMTMDDQEATISVGTTFPIPEITRGVGGQGDVVSFEYRDVNISLRVTPHVGEDETISLFVNPQVEEVIGEVSVAGNSAPITSLRKVETVVSLKNNETVVIGGLIRENSTDTLRKVWLLGDIPLIGNLFRSKSKSKKQTDLLIFITPRIVSN